MLKTKFGEAFREAFREAFHEPLNLFEALLT